MDQPGDFVSDLHHMGHMVVESRDHWLALVYVEFVAAVGHN